jgi:hypothetical protein
MQEKPVDVRFFLQDQPCNERNAAGNTFFYQLVLDCPSMVWTEELNEKLAAHVKKHGGCISNPFLSHTKIENGKEVTQTASEKAEKLLKTTGNPVCGYLAEFLKQTEVMYFDHAASKQGRHRLVSQKANPNAQDFSDYK